MKSLQNLKILDFMKYQWLYFGWSGILLLISVFALFQWGLNPAIDFTGGTMIEIKGAGLTGKNDEIITAVKDSDLAIGSIQSSGEDSYILRMKYVTQSEKEKLWSLFNERFGEIEETGFETVGPTLGKELIRKTITAIVLAAGFILFYVARRFKDKKYGVCAILAMFHDSLILLGVFSLLGHFYNVEIDTLFVTAVLTVLSFSVHDTVVVYDRIREGVKLFPKADFTDLVNKAVAETLGRSVNNSLTIVFMLMSLYFLGGETIRWFVFALLVGTVSGTYSSTFVAAPLLIWWDRRKKKN